MIVGISDGRLALQIVRSDKHKQHYCGDSSAGNSLSADKSENSLIIIISVYYYFE